MKVNYAIDESYPIYSTTDNEEFADGKADIPRWFVWYHETIERLYYRAQNRFEDYIGRR